MMPYILFKIPICYKHLLKGKVLLMVKNKNNDLRIIVKKILNHTVTHWFTYAESNVHHIVMKTVVSAIIKLKLKPQREVIYVTLRSCSHWSETISSKYNKFLPINTTFWSLKSFWLVPFLYLHYKVL